MNIDYCDLIRQLKVYLDIRGQSECPAAEAIREQCSILWEQMSSEDQEEVSKWGISYLCK